MKSSVLGKSTSVAEVTGIFRTGIMIHVDREYFLPYERCPKFKTAKAEDVFSVEFDGEDLHWPALDIDMELESLRHPERFPLVWHE
ncbi:MAG: hypothetical protein A3K19_12250 [Lentisphaerae bacterium RIFOXYB12_FULL_65_16]|nr:MAG: hypothetical protein A3K18_28065 [Lentisphaerae bacterium RIFOXYA12_64_32]OGV86178.1 MAG: hypothetical protein A3K19_12250 [Lentisphaerae bacterium RIFOXYB12_FULL_65_16]